MSSRADQIRLVRYSLIASGFDTEVVTEFINRWDSWYALWERFKAVALGQYRNNIRRGDRDFKAQMDILAELRWQGKGGGDKEFEVNNNHAPKFAAMFNAITHSDHFELRRKGGKSKHEGRAAA